ncbi:TonB-dependent receptor [Occallatibacter savannae]|uniref:TonB-dependent receptor n=1 Tax=Occallatibacter savannae TaxID=1002691 RepID=UPI0013A58E80|nr:TonB-dependent receptor [Occallatibacter savannae]
MLFCLLGAAAQTAPKTAPKTTQILVENASGTPLAGVAVQIVDDSARDAQIATVTGSDGLAIVHCPAVESCVVQLSLPGYLSQRQALNAIDIAQGSTFQIVLSRTMQEQQNVTVEGDTAAPLVQTESIQAELEMESVKTTPLRPATLIDTLPLVPGVSRTQDGRVIIGGIGEAHSALLINSVNVTDPATGNFGLSVPVDSVEEVKVSISPFLAQYGNFISGVVSAETRRGGEKWTYSLNDPLPEFRIRSGHLRGLRSATPRVNVSGPVLANHLYLLEGAEVLINKDQVRTLPFPENQIRSQAFNSFTQLDGILNPKQTITATFHFAPHQLDHANLNYFDPQPVTPNAAYHEDTGTVLHRWALGKGLFTSTFSGTRVAATVAPQSSGQMNLTPIGNSGTYFGRGTREATRFQWLETWAPAPIDWHGRHQLGVGSTVAHAEDSGTFSGSPVQIRDGSGNLLRTINFTAPGSFDLADTETALYAQDHWMAGRLLALDVGIRAETQTLTHTNRVAPRAGFTLLPATASRIAIRGGIGVFYSEVPLNMYAFSSYPKQVVTTYDGKGSIIDGPREFINLTGQSHESEFPFILQRNVGGNFAPCSVGWNVEAERSMGSEVTLRAQYIHNDLRNQLTLEPMIAPEASALVLGSAGEGKLRQVALTAGFGHEPKRQFFASYVHQMAQGRQTDASAYLGDFPFPVVRSAIAAANPGELPNRFLLWGTADLPKSMHIAPHVEWRNGFPFQPVDALRQYVDLTGSSQPRFPAFFSADATVSKDINLNPKHAVRLSVTGINLTDHMNPLQVHDNVADPRFGSFFGNYGRHILFDFDVLF